MTSEERSEFVTRISDDGAVGGLSAGAAECGGGGYDGAGDTGVGNDCGEAGEG